MTEVIFKWVSVEVAADAAGVSPWTIRHMIADGRLDPSRGLRRLGRRTMIDLSTFKTAVERGEL